MQGINILSLEQKRKLQKTHKKVADVFIDSKTEFEDKETIKKVPPKNLTPRTKEMHKQMKK